MDVDGSAERRGPACVGVDVAHAETRTETDGYGDVEGGRQGARYERARYIAPAWEEGQTCPGCRPGENGERRDDVEEPELRRRRWRRRWRCRRNGRDTEGTCYALRDMAEARGIHNFVKTKMLRSCLGGVAFFLVSRNVQARLSLRPSSCPSLFPLPSSARRFFPSSPTSGGSLFPPPLLHPPLVSSLSELPPRIIPFSFLR